MPVTEAEAEALALAAATDVTDAMASDERVTPCRGDSSASLHAWTMHAQNGGRTHRVGAQGRRLADRGLHIRTSAGGLDAGREGGDEGRR